MKQHCWQILFKYAGVPCAGYAPDYRTALEFRFLDAHAQITCVDRAELGSKGTCVPGDREEVAPQ